MLKTLPLPKVLIEVRGGVATYRTKGSVAVCLVDYEALAAGDSFPVSEEFLDAFEGLRETVCEATGERDDHGNHPCTSWQDF